MVWLAAPRASASGARLGREVGTRWLFRLAPENDIRGGARANEPNRSPSGRPQTSRIPLASRSSRGVLRRRRCGPPPGNCGGSSVAARMKIRHSTGMPSVLHSNPTDTAIVDMYVIVLPAETDLALTADRNAPPLGLESPNETPADSRRRAQIAPETVLTAGPRLTSRSRHT